PLARLISHGVRIDLNRLFGPAQPVKARRTYKVRCGGEAIVDRVKQAASAILRESHEPTPPLPVLRTMAGTIAQAHRAVLRAQTAVQERTLAQLSTQHIWGPEDLREFASGRVASVFGPRFAEVDQYPTRV